MTTLQFADTHNLVAFLSKPAESEGFEQIVDFLNANPIKYALTINPTIYTSCIEQFWATVKVKTVNGEVQLQALVDGKKIIITEASVRRDLQLNDEEGTDCLPNATIFEELTRMGIYVTPSHTKKIFENIRMVGKDFSGRETPLFLTMMVQAQEEMGEGSANPTDPYHTPIIIQPSTSQPQKKQKLRKPKRKDTEVPQPSGPTTNVADEVVYKEMDGNLERATTNATSLDAEHDRGNINKTQSKVTLNEPSSLGTSSCSGPRCQDNMGGTISQTGFENVSKTSNDLLLAGEITSLKKRVKRLEKKNRSRTHQAQKIRSRTHKLKRLYKVGRSARVISSDEASLGDQEDVSKQGRIADIDAHEDIYLVNVHRDKDIFGVNDQDDADMFDVNTLIGDEVIVESEVAAKKKD
ncbi:hypothetical protein Tco_1435179, partial [Tanacetum coccineum]